MARLLSRILGAAGGLYATVLMITKRQIIVKVGYTYNLGDYSNIRPEVQVSGEVSDSEPFHGVVKFLQDEALSACYDLIDQHLEKMGEPAEFSVDRRFSAHVFLKDKLILLMPDVVFAEYRDTYRSWNHHEFTHHRLQPIQRLLAKKYPGFTVREYTDIPPRNDVPEHCFYVETDNAFFLGRGQWSDLPVFIRKYQEDYEQAERLWVVFSDDVKALAHEKSKPWFVTDDPKDQEDLLKYGYAEELKVRYEEEQRQQAEPSHADPFLDDEDEDDYDEEDDDDE